MTIKPGNVLIGIASSGVHSNGFSLVRKVLPMTEEGLHTYYKELGGELGEVLLAPTKIYVKALNAVKDAGVKILGCSHITGGGFIENVPRMLPEDGCALIRKDSYPVPPIFELLRREGQIEEEIMYNTFNMGIGMVLAVAEEDADKAVKALENAGEKAYVIGEIIDAEEKIRLV